MRHIIGLLLAGVALHAADYKMEKREPVHHTFAKNATLDVDVVSGAIVVLGDGGNGIRVDGERVIRAENQDELNKGQREVSLDLTEKDDTARIYENGPFRGKGGHRDSHFDVAYNLTIHAPAMIALHLRNLNGSLKAQDISGALDVKTVNGGIDLSNISGSGSVETVNGSVVAGFRENPRAETRFRSVNGRIEVGLQSGLNADISVKTVNGQAYTDFETTIMGSGTAARGTRSLRVGSGGPALSLETVNGSIRITKKDRK